MRILSCFAAALALFGALPAQAEERITSFVSDVTVQPDGALDVVETIDLVSEGNQIQRGIQRDFPTRYANRTGGMVNIGFDVVAVSRDGRPEPYERLMLSNGERVRIGDAATMLPPGEHRYRIQYRTTRQLTFYSDVDELYWNATGNGWPFAIDRAEARITLPKAVRFGQRAFYTGEQGSTAKDAAVVAERPGRIVFRTTGRLAPGEGLTVAAAWPKGIVAAPGTLTKLGWRLADWGAMMVAVGGVIALLAYWARAVWLARRHPDPRPLVPLFAPPEDLSAAAMRYVWRKGFDDRAFAAAIVDVAVRGRLRIVEKPAPGAMPERTLERVDGAAILPPGEAQMVARLFKSRKSVALRQSNHAKLRAAQNALEKNLDARYGEGHTFTDAPRTNLLGWKLIGGLMLLVAFVLVLGDSRVAPWILPGLIAGMIGAMLLLRSLAWYRRPRPSGRRPHNTLGWIAYGLLWLMLVGLGGTLLLYGLASGNPLPALVPLIAIPFLLLARASLVVPTAAGWALRDGIRGFRHYLSVAEEDRLDALNPPEKTTALFERYLPYAMALDVENRWAKRFADLVEHAGTAGAPASRSWYVGGSTTSWSDTRSFAAAMGGAFSTSIASAATAPSSSSSSSGSSSSSSSSGSSGGGSSGGGGGGGGGSGW